MTKCLAPFVCLVAGIGMFFSSQKMEGCCSFKVIVGGVCGFNPKDRKRNSEIVPLLSCMKDIDSHKSTYKFTGPEDEVELVLCRAGKFSKSESLRTMTICPNHRTKLGLGWSRGSSARCRVPAEIFGHGKGKGLWPKGERGLGKNESEAVLRKTGLLVQVGSGKTWFSFCELITDCTPT